MSNYDNHKSILEHLRQVGFEHKEPSPSHNGLARRAYGALYDLLTEVGAIEAPADPEPEIGAENDAQGPDDLEEN